MWKKSTRTDFTLRRFRGFSFQCLVLSCPYYAEFLILVFYQRVFMVTWLLLLLLLLPRRRRKSVLTVCGAACRRRSSCVGRAGLTSHYSTFESFISVSNLIKEKWTILKNKPKLGERWDFCTKWGEFLNKFNFHVVRWCVSINKCRMYTWGNICAQQMYIIYKNIDTPE